MNRLWLPLTYLVFAPVVGHAHQEDYETVIDCAVTMSRIAALEIAMHGRVADDFACNSWHTFDKVKEYNQYKWLSALSNTEGDDFPVEPGPDNRACKVHDEQFEKLKDAKEKLTADFAKLCLPIFTPTE